MLGYISFHPTYKLTSFCVLKIVECEDKYMNKENTDEKKIVGLKPSLQTNFIGMVERGERNTYVDKIFKLADAFEISLAKLFETL